MKVVWTAIAEITFEAEQDYILKKWNIEKVINFIDLVDGTIKKLQEFPQIGKLINDERYFVVSQQTTLIYRVLEEKETIEILLFWNNKWNPTDLKSLLN